MSSRKSIARQIGHSCLIVYINQIMADYQFKGDVIQISPTTVVGTMIG